MDKITSFMRVTKKRKAQGESGVVKPPLAPEKAAVQPAATLKKQPPEPTAQETDADGELYENSVHVPQFIFATVHYERQGARHAVDATTQRVVAYIADHYETPPDFETSYRFGPHSGSTYESRLLRAYKFKLLAPKKPHASVPVMCISCATLGHVDRDCPDGF